MKPAPPSPPASLAELETILQAIVNPVGIPSVAYGIWQRGETLLLGASGLADKDALRQATSGTPYAMASVTKPMTATAVALLASRGHFGLDDPINPLLGDARIQSRAGDAGLATIRNVADHSAGLPVHCQFYYEDEPFGKPPMEEIARRYAKTFSPVGAVHRYSNLGYGLLERLIEQVSGRGYAEFMAEEIFRPLAMGASSMGAPESGKAVSYGPDGVAYPRYDFDHAGGSAAYSSVEDLLTFGRFHLGHGPALLSADQLGDMRWPSSRIDEIRGYGFGWGMNEDRLGYKIVQHTGFMGGVSTVLRLVPELDLVIAILLNGQSDMAWRSVDDCMAALLPEFRAKLDEERAKPAEPKGLEPVPDEILGTWSGSIETHAGNHGFRLQIAGDSEATALLGGVPAVVKEVQMSNRRLLGVFEGNLRTEDAGRYPYRIHLDLSYGGDRLSGSALTVTDRKDGGGGLRGNRMGNALAYWTDLGRV